MAEATVIRGDSFYEKRKKLKLVKQLNWENYYEDEETKEKWVEEYPQSSLQGGGEPQLDFVR